MGAKYPVPFLQSRKINLFILLYILITYICKWKNGRTQQFISIRGRKNVHLIPLKFYYPVA